MHVTKLGMATKKIKSFWKQILSMRCDHKQKWNTLVSIDKIFVL